tara:strand:- start:937 stop:1260 length:324 start_codon:yes stop_codon:yes gene_type:complete
LTNDGRGGGELSKYDYNKVMRLFAVETINKFIMRNPTIFEAHFIRQKITRMILDIADTSDLICDIHGEDDGSLENLKELLIIANQTLEQYEKRYFKYESTGEFSADS